MPKPIGPGDPVSPDRPLATPESYGISGQQTRSHPHRPHSVGSYSTAPREKSAQTGYEALHPAKARLLQLLPALQKVKTILNNTKPATSLLSATLKESCKRCRCELTNSKSEVLLLAPEAEELGASGSIRLKRLQKQTLLLSHPPSA